MTEKKPRHALHPDVEDDPTPADEPPCCNLDGCTRLPEWRGLCPAHRQTHRGLAGPKEDL